MRIIDFNAVNALFRYEPDTGIIYRRVTSGTRWMAGSIAGRVAPSAKKYIDIHIGRTPYGAHRLAWILYYGIMPSGVIDHINGDTKDNRISNLRDVENRVNKQNIRKANVNNKLGMLGVRKTVKNKFTSTIYVDDKSHHLGTFNTAEEAGTAYLNAKRVLHKEGCTI